MHPAPSIIIFTTLSGAGFGLIAWLGLGFGPEDAAFGIVACGLAFLLTGAGLVASLFHLGNPQRAWRALSQWRSSWLSREGVLAVATLAAFALYAALWVAGAGRIWPLGVLSSLLAFATVYATSMIYGSIRAVPRWSRSPTPFLFLAYAAAGGALAFLAASLPFGGVPARHHALSAALIAIAGAAALLWTASARRIGLSSGGSSPESAIGLAHLGKARLFEAPHTAPNYLMKEMVFRIGRKHAQKLRVIAFNGAFMFPLLSIGAGAFAPSLALISIVALPVHLLGVAASRWLFFAEAEHVVSLYYGYR
jgi:DMSO reductase anchor subunit